MRIESDERRQPQQARCVHDRPRTAPTRPESQAQASECGCGRPLGLVLAPRRLASCGEPTHDRRSEPATGESRLRRKESQPQAGRITLREGSKPDATETRQRRGSVHESPIRRSRPRRDYDCHHMIMMAIKCKSVVGIDTSRRWWGAGNRGRLGECVVAGRAMSSAPRHLLRCRSDHWRGFPPPTKHGHLERYAITLNSGVTS